ncbi:MAG: alanine racemase [Lawsonibacter sp.]|nr:alanine racemase [Lawsonibacter sp.]
MTNMTQMRTWAEIDLDALEHNYRALRAMAPQSCKFLGLVKSNAYGHGAVPVAKKLQALGADMLAVACLAEAKELREAGVTLPLLCLGETSSQLVDLLLEFDVTQTVEDLETGRALSAAAEAAGKRLSIHVKLDTGMTRLGFRWRRGEDNGDLLDQISALCALPGLKAEGMFTHFADADGSEAYTIDQLTQFLDAKAALEERGVCFAITHCSASAAVLNYPCAHMDMIRPGIALYGYYPAPEMEGLDGPGLEPVMTVNSRICAVRAVPAGTCVSYGRTATLKRDSRLAVVPIGYGDGYPRRLSNRMDMVIHGVPCPIVGRVCMDMCMVDVTDLPDVKAGDTAKVYGPDLTERAARLTDTIVYELLCNLSNRVPRVYLERGTKN